MSLHSLKVISSVLIGFSVLSLSSPVISELIATMAPIFSRRAAASVLELGIPYEVVHFDTKDGVTLRGWFFPADEAAAPAILYAPATSRDQRSGLSLALPFHRAGYHVLLFSYRGHGQSDGNRFGFTYGAKESSDVDAAVRFLSEDKGIKQIGAIGHSAGAVSVLLSAAGNSRIRAVVAASAFPTLEEVWNSNRPAILPRPLLDLARKWSEIFRGYSQDEVRPKDVIGQISPRPILIVHGAEDKRISREQATDLFVAADGPKQLWLVEDAGHGEVRSPVLDTLVEDIIAFFDGAFRNSPQKPQ